MPVKLNQVLAIEKSVKNRAETTFTKAHQTLLKVEVLSGLQKTYQPKDEDGEQFPGETKKVQVKAQDELKKVKSALTELFDATGARDASNCHAKADVVVDGKTLLKDVPATHLLFLEKKLVDLHTFVKKLPTLDSAENWKYDNISGLFVTEPVQTTKTKRVVKHNVVVPATKEHPAQVKESPEDVVVGTWSTTKQSGALQTDEVNAMLERVEKLQKAVKFAREEANSAQAVQLKTGDAVLGYIFG